MAVARGRIPSAIQGLLKSDMETVIEQANLGREDAAIARLYLIDRIPQMDIAEELGLGRATVCRRLPNILERLERAVQK